MFICRTRRAFSFVDRLEYKYLLIVHCVNYDILLSEISMNVSSIFTAVLGKEIPTGASIRMIATVILDQIM